MKSLGASQLTCLKKTSDFSFFLMILNDDTKWRLQFLLLAPVLSVKEQELLKQPKQRQQYDQYFGQLARLFRLRLLLYLCVLHQLLPSIAPVYRSGTMEGSGSPPAILRGAVICSGDQ